MLKKLVNFGPIYGAKFSGSFKIQRVSETFIRKYTEARPTHYPRRIFSGIQPTGNMHLGNYLGAIRKWVELQNSGDDAIFSIVDMHTITLKQNSQELRENILKMTAMLLACGIDPEKSILFQQSSIPMHAELSWILGCLSTLPRLYRLPQFKEKSEKMKDVPLGLLIYPILQVSDILLYKATHIPVGEDQLQHLQLAEHLAQKFNTTYGSTFPLPQAIVSSVDSNRIKSLRDPTKKMSKSHLDVKGCLDLNNEPDEILKKVKQALTDFTSEVTYDPTNRPGVSNLITIHSLITGKSPEIICKEAEGLDTGKYKMVVADAIIETLKPIQKRYHQYIAEPYYLEQILRGGAGRAEAIAIPNWLEVRTKVGYGVATMACDTSSMEAFSGM